MKKILLIFCLAFTLCLTGCSQNFNDNENNVNIIVEKIDALPEVDYITLENEDEIMVIDYEYNLLSEEEKKEVTNYNKFFQAKNKIKQLNDTQQEIVNEINELIDELPNVNKITLNHYSYLEEIESLLSMLTNNFKETIDNLEKFNEAKDKYNELEREKVLREQAEEIIGLINNIPVNSDLTLEDEEQIVLIRKQYDSLEEDAKKMVSNYENLENSEKLIETLKKHNEFDPGEILGCVSDVATSSCEDELITGNDDFSIEWRSSNNDLYNIINNVGKVSKIYQTHKAQYVTVTARINFSEDEFITLTKEVKVDPVLFEDLPDTPVATYFQTSALSSYLDYSDRYKEEGTLFSDKAKEVLDIIYYSFAHVMENGGLYLSDFKTIEEIKKLKENDVRIILCISGVSSSGSKIFKQLTSDSKKRSTFISNIIKMIEKYNFDGVDIDWESSEGAYVVAENMNALMKDLRRALNASQDKGGSPYLLTAAIPSTSWGAAVDRFDFKTLNDYVDYINMMSYDLNNPDKATHVSSVYSSSNDKGYGFSCDYGVNLFTSRGLDKNKIILGAAGYGKAYKVGEIGSNTKYPALSSVATLTYIDGVPGSHATGTVFLNAINIVLQTGKYQKYTEYNNKGQIVGSYLYNEEEKIFITYDSPEAIAAKYDYAQANEGMGIMCWAYTEDTSDNYINTIYDKIK